MRTNQEAKVTPSDLGDTELGGGVGSGGHPGVEASASKVLSALCAARKTVNFYPAGHPLVREALADLLEKLTRLLEHSDSVTFSILGDELFYEDVLIFDQSPGHVQLIKEVQDHGINTFSFHVGCDERELWEFVSLLCKEPEETRAAGGLAGALMAADVAHVSAGVVKEDESRRDESEDQESELEDARGVYIAAVDLMRDVWTNLRFGRALQVNRVRGVVRSIVDSALENKEAMLELSSLKNYDEYTFYHSVNVAVLSVMVLSMLTLDDRSLVRMGTAAILHDVGKVDIPVSIVNKPGPLNTEEWEVVRRHPIAGAEVLCRSPGIDSIAVVAAFQHHMGCDASGYPKVGTGGGLHLFSRIVGIADAYDAMTTRRVYSGAKLPDRALAILMENAGGSLDPVLTKLFINAIGIYPVRTIVLLTTGEVGIVDQLNPREALRPKVRVVMDSDGKICHPNVVDLTEVGGRGSEPVRSVVRTVYPSELDFDMSIFY